MNPTSQLFPAIRQLKKRPDGATCVFPSTWLLMYLDIGRESDDELAVRPDSRLEEVGAALAQLRLLRLPVHLRLLMRRQCCRGGAPLWYLSNQPIIAKLV